MKSCLTKVLIFTLGLGLLVSAAVLARENTAGKRPEVFVAIPGDGPIKTQLRYFTANNFVGESITGYQSPMVYLTRPTHQALLAVAGELAVFGLGLKVFDAYRPQRAVDHFVRWAKDLTDTRMKSRYYPRVDKANLFSKGYISARSGHSRGSTVDLTLIDLATGDELDMGTPWDYFDPMSWGNSDQITAEQRANRALLRIIMTKHGFNPLREEWWHFTLADEPFPDTYFDFPIQ